MSPELIILLGIALLFTVDKVLGMLKTRGIDLPKMARQIDELWRWHSKEDEEGVKVWYVRRSLEESLKTLAKNIGQQTTILEQIHREQIVMHKEVSKLKAQ